MAKDAMVGQDFHEALIKSLLRSREQGGFPLERPLLLESGACM